MSDERRTEYLRPRASKGPAIALAGPHAPLALDDPNNLPHLKALKKVLPELTGSSVPQLVERMVQELAPELMARYYPRIYEATGRYHSPKQCAAFLANSVLETQRVSYDKTPTAYRLMMPALEPMAQRGMPMFFIAPDLLEAVLRTDFSDDIDWTELALPYEQGIFILPKGAFVHPTDGEVSMIIWARFQKGDYPLPPRLGRAVTEIRNQAMVLLALCPDNSIWYDSCLSAEHRKVLQLRNLFYRAPGEPSPKVRKSSFMDEDLSEKDEPFLDNIGTIAFGTLLAMNARPELLERGKLLRKVAKGEKVREFWSPNVIGSRYKLKREVPKVVGGKFVHATREGGTHASPRMHWRRGHFRNQAHGEGRRDRKTIWIEPTLIGATE